ncbi:type II toxin-antitoxin system RelE/ParE family toxin [Bartonella sp. HY038]|uniref:type II toxin-antitoxin system RelE/ParE family toxin n=1 Tax=Bartonella sp. HY038 TaxID=2759660 RepID=UPI0015FE5B6F|nr:type II toxin-antitoxin system RelE/ParE family toxin [Bartonella sp. HY038]
MLIEFTQEAQNDLEKIADYIASDNPKRAYSFVQEIRAKCENIASIPRGFPLVSRYEHLNIRRCIFGNYLIFYRIKEDTILIIRIIHGASDYTNIL